MTGVDGEFADLLPLFVSEARARLETLATLLARLPTEPEVMGELRRELHTLKGASRMLSLAPIATLCHAAEEFVQAAPPEVAPLLLQVLDTLATMVDAVAQGQAPTLDPQLVAALAPATAPAPQEPAREPPSPPPTTPAPAAPRADDLLEEAADRAVALRIRTRALARFATRLDELAALAEHGVSDAGPAQVLAVLIASLRREALALARHQRQLAWTAETHLETLLSLQMQPLRPFFLVLARHARELARELGKEVEVEVRGEDTTLDRRIVKSLEDAVLHLVRNAVDHGIEAPTARMAAGKPRAGRLRLGAEPAGGRVRLTIADDGAGIDVAAVAAMARERGFLPPGACPDPDELLHLLLRPGFSTRRTVSTVSGRGIGLDVVAAVASRLGGQLTIASQPRRGTTFTLEVPAARRGARIVVARVGPMRFGIPAAVVQRVVALAPHGIQHRDGEAVALLDEGPLPFLPLPAILGVESAARQMLLVGSVAGEPLAVAVDTVEGEEEVLLRAAPTLDSDALPLDGIALLASGEPVAVLSPLALSPRRGLRAGRLAMPPPARRRLRVLLVEDSFVTREMERRLLEDAGFEVVGAASAADGFQALAAGTFDCVVTDIEMPEMDGLEFTRALRADPILTTVPVVVVSTRSRREDRLAALQAGADAYFVKQGLDALELVAMVRRLCGQ